MGALTLTDKLLRSLGPGEYWDTILPGFGVRVSPKGKKVFFLRHRRLGQNRRDSLGQFDFVTLQRAREKARIILAAPHDYGPDKTVAELVAAYVEWLPHAGFKRADEYRRYLERDVAAIWSRCSRQSPGAHQCTPTTSANGSPPSSPGPWCASGWGLTLRSFYAAVAFPSRGAFSTSQASTSALIHRFAPGMR
jgi:hypothetical protein